MNREPESLCIDMCRHRNNPRNPQCPSHFQFDSPLPGYTYTAVQDFRKTTLNRKLQSPKETPILLRSPGHPNMPKPRPDAVWAGISEAACMQHVYTKAVSTVLPKLLCTLGWKLETLALASREVDNLRHQACHKFPQL